MMLDVSSVKTVMMMMMMMRIVRISTLTVVVVAISISIIVVVVVVAVIIINAVQRRKRSVIQHHWRNRRQRLSGRASHGVASTGS